MNITDEQQACVNADAKAISINAFAGTGKTSTLIARAKAHPQRKFLYLAFNRSMADDATRRFPSNVICKSSHSLAYGRIGRDYSGKLGNNKATAFMDLLREDWDLDRKTSDALFFSKTIQDIVSDYLCSDAPTLDIPERKWKVMDEGGRLIDPKLLAQAANIAWRVMREKDDLRLKMHHDGYLKMYQVTHPQLQYDEVFLDEAQDTNPCLFSLVAAQKRASLILVGDMHQAIYGFRGAMNAILELLKKFPDAQDLALTRSFRFNQRMARIPNTILNVFMKEKRLITGMANHDSTIKSRCVLHRTNAGVFRTAVRATTQSSASFSFIGGIEGYQFDLLLQSYFLSKGNIQMVRDPFLRRFKRFSELEAYADTANDKEVLARLKIIMEFGDQIPALIAAIEEKQAPKGTGFVELGTAHKAKGLEWDFVRLHNDFPTTMIDGIPALLPDCSEEDALPLEEANLLYVACTRARKGIKLNEDLNALLSWASEIG